MKISNHKEACDGFSLFNLISVLVTLANDDHIYDKKLVTSHQQLILCVEVSFLICPDVKGNQISF